MAAGLGFKEFATGDILTAADANGYLASQTVMVFASAAARTSAIASPQEGMFSFLKDTNATQFYDGAAWTNLDTTGMVNPMTTTGDTIYSSSGTTPARLGIGSTGQVLTVAGGLPSWATPSAGGGGLTFIKKQTIGSAVSSVTVTSAFSATYDNYLIIVSDGVGSAAGTSSMTLGATTAAYYMSGFYLSPTGSTVTGFNINNGASWSSTYYTTSNNGGHIILQSPFLSKRTTFQSVLIGADSGSNYAHYLGHLQNTTSYTDFTLTASGGTTMTGGEIRVYGYQNS